MMNKELMDNLVKVLQQAFSDTGLQHNSEIQEALAHLATNSCNLITVKRGQSFIQAGFPANTIWVLLDGSTQVICYNRQGGYCVQDAPKKTQIFGLMEQLCHQPNYTATVYASSDCCMMRIPAGIFMVGLEISIPLLRLALEDLCVLAERAMNQSELQTLYSPRDYLVFFLNQYCARETTFPCTVNITRKEIAELLHMNLRSLYRYINDLKQDGLFTIVHGKIVISKEQANLLHEYCQGL